MHKNRCTKILHQQTIVSIFVLYELSNILKINEISNQIVLLLNILKTL